LMSALAAGHLIRAHMAHNRSQANTPAPSVPGTPGGIHAPATITAIVDQPAKGKAGAREPLTPSSSMGSLPPYSARP